MGDVPTIHISEAELASDVHSVLAKVRDGIEVVIEQENRPVAILKATESVRPGRKLKDCIALAEAYEAALGEPPTADEDFARDVQAGIDARRDTYKPPEWD